MPAGLTVTPGRVTEFRTPVRHWLVEGVDAGGVLPELPAADWPGWVRYDNGDERKRASRDAAALGPQAAALFRRLAGWAGPGGWLTRLTGVGGLEADADLHGGGVHVTDPGGFLRPHLDYALAPHRAGLERRVNAVLFLNGVWAARWGGALCFHDDLGERVLRRYWPEAGAAVVWEAGDLAYHSVEPTSPDAPPRVTAAVYFLAPARPGATRKRALFVPRRGPA